MRKKMVTTYSTAKMKRDFFEADAAAGSFSQTLLSNDLKLERGRTNILQINLGLKCNQVCTHCHLEAGPGRKEWMTRETMDEVVVFVEKGNFHTVDITGGAPELHLNLIEFIRKLSGVGVQIILRSNLSVLHDKGDSFISELKAYGVNIVASFPSLNKTQTDSMRGKGIFSTSVSSLKKLNNLEYGVSESGPLLDLVVNPSGAFLPPPQESLEKRFKKVLEQKWGISFNRVFSFANVPLGRFQTWLIQSGNYDSYMEKLAAAFNPSAIDGLMCRTLISVSWDGYLFDCDFNQAAGLLLGNKKMHISHVEELPESGTPIVVDNHCYTCAAGTGFT